MSPPLGLNATEDGSLCELPVENGESLTALRLVDVPVPEIVNTETVPSP
jgi:hypothetical protein